MEIRSAPTKAERGGIFLAGRRAARREPNARFLPFPPSLPKPGSRWEMPRARAAPAPRRRRGGRDLPFPPPPRLRASPATLAICPHFRAIFKHLPHPPPPHTPPPEKKKPQSKQPQPNPNPKTKKKERERGQRGGGSSPPPSRPRRRAEGSRGEPGLDGGGGGEEIRRRGAGQLLPEEGRSEYRVQ